MPYYRGQAGKFRKALAQAGFTNASKDTIYSDPHVDGSRRLKLVVATSIFDSCILAQENLETKLREQLGDDIVSMYFIRYQPYWMKNETKIKSLCIQLKK